MAASQETVPKSEERAAAPRRRSAQVRVDAARIKFEGRTLAPFAHTRFCIKYPSECHVHKTLFRGGPIELTAARRQELIRVNAEVNRTIIATNMNEPVAEEKWVISPKTGDCNDYAVTKRHELMARGWPARALLLAEVVTTWGEHHLVLVVRTREGDFVADNLNANIRNWTKAPYEWVRMESPANPMYWSKVAAPQPEAVAMAARASQL
jgi:predicted transglutaminase-like cysteine proteinase